jgi:hypothetical protein
MNTDKYCKDSGVLKTLCMCTAGTTVNPCDIYGYRYSQNNFSVPQSRTWNSTQQAGTFPAEVLFFFTLFLEEQTVQCVSTLSAQFKLAQLSGCSTWSSTGSLTGCYILIISEKDDEVSYQVVAKFLVGYRPHIRPVDHHHWFYSLLQALTAPAMLFHWLCSVP